MKFLRWPKSVWHWLFEFRRVWLTLLVIVLASSIAHCLGADEATIRITGLFLQLLGIGTIFVETHETRVSFGHPSMFTLLREWLSRFPPFKSRVTFGSTNATLPMLTGKGFGYTSLPSGSSLEAVREYLNDLGAALSRTQSEMYQEFRKLSDELRREQQLRESVDQEIHKKLENTATGGLHISAMGAFWLIVGVVMSTISVELAKWLK